MGQKHGKHEEFVAEVAKKEGRGRSGTLIIADPHNLNSNNNNNNSSSSSNSGGGGQQWKPLRRNGHVIVSFDATDEYILSLRVGERVEVYETCEGWYRGAVISTGGQPRNGIFPSPYIELNDEVPNDTQTQKSAVMLRLEEIREKKRKLQEEMERLRSPAAAESPSSRSSQRSQTPPPSNANVGRKPPPPPPPPSSTSNTVKARKKRAPPPPPLPTSPSDNAPMPPASTVGKRVAPPPPPLENLDAESDNDIMESFNIIADAQDRASIEDVRHLLPTLIDDLTSTQIEAFVRDAQVDGFILRHTYAEAMNARNWLGDIANAAKHAGLSHVYLEHSAQLVVSFGSSDLERDAMDILNVMDPNNTGWVDTYELLEVIDEIITGDIGDVQLERMFTEADPNGEGRISRLQFLKMVKMALEPPPDPGQSQHLPIFSRKRSDTKLDNKK